MESKPKEEKKKPILRNALIDNRSESALSDNRITKQRLLLRNKDISKSGSISEMKSEIP
jgi:hypothetical protein